MADFQTVFNDGIPWQPDGSATIEDFNSICSPLEVLGYRKLAIEIAVDLIANSFATTKWIEYKIGKQVKGKAFALLNIAPNRINTSQDFMKQVARKLLLDHEALIVPIGNEMYLADRGFGREFTSFNRVKYDNVQINGYKTPKQQYFNDSVIYLTLNNKDLIAFIKAYQADYNNVLKSATGSYQSNKLKKYYLDSDAYRAQTSKVQEDFNDLVEDRLKTFLNSTKNVSVFAKPKGYEIKQLQDSQLETASDVRGLISDVFTMTANAFHIPPEMIFGGSINQLIIDNYLMNAVYPLVETFNNGFNVWNYSVDEITKDTYIKADTTAMRLLDLNTVGNFIQKVFPTGALTLGDVITKYLHLDKPEKEIADLRVITKNYGTVEQFLNGELNGTTTTENVDYTNENETGDNTDGN